MKIPIRSFWPAIFTFVLATFLFCLPGKKLPEQDWLSFIHIDKWVHVGLFAVLVSFWCLPLIFRIPDRKRTFNIFKWIALIAFGYGVLMEFVQENFIPFRTFGIDDMIADAIGCGIGLWFANDQLKRRTDPNP